MKINCKRKVQAQRKFAQGAYVPPHNNITQARSEIPVVKDNCKSVIHSRFTAKSLLDVVSFQSIHPHVTPIVVLERLSNDATKVNANAKKMVKVKPEVKDLRVVKAKNKVLKNTMCLRSKTRVRDRTISKLNSPKRRQQQHRQRSAVSTRILRAEKSACECEQTLSTRKRRAEKSAYVSDWERILSTRKRLVEKPAHVSDWDLILSMRKRRAGTSAYVSNWERILSTRKRRAKKSAPVSDWEDERPLKYLKRNKTPGCSVSPKQIKKATSKVKDRVFAPPKAEIHSARKDSASQQKKDTGTSWSRERQADVHSGRNVSPSQQKKDTGMIWERGGQRAATSSIETDEDDVAPIHMIAKAEIHSAWKVSPSQQKKDTEMSNRRGGQSEIHSGRNVSPSQQKKDTGMSNRRGGQSEIHSGRNVSPSQQKKDTGMSWKRGGQAEKHSTRNVSHSQLNDTEMSLIQGGHGGIVRIPESVMAEIPPFESISEDWSVEDDLIVLPDIQQRTPVVAEPLDQNIPVIDLCGIVRIPESVTEEIRPESISADWSVQNELIVLPDIQQRTPVVAETSDQNIPVIDLCESEHAIDFALEELRLSQTLAEGWTIIDDGTMELPDTEQCRPVVADPSVDIVDLFKTANIIDSGISLHSDDNTITPPIETSESEVVIVEPPASERNVQPNNHIDPEPISVPSSSGVSIVTKNLHNDNISDFAVPQPPSSYRALNYQKRVSNWVDNDAGFSHNAARLESRRNSTCPSENYPTIGEAVHAVKALKETFCKTCHKCQRINKVMQISALIQLGFLPSENEIDSYEYTLAKDAELKAPSYKNKRPNCRLSLVPENQHMHLDLLPEDNPHVVELKSIKVPNQNKNIISARLVLRTDAKKIKEISWAEQDKLVDQLLYSLMHCEKDNTNNTRSGPSICDSMVPYPPGYFSANGGKLVEAPVYYPDEHDFKDPIAYFEKIMPSASKFGLCKVVAPEGFNPSCNLEDEIKFRVTNQYIARMYTRWGIAAREMSAIKAYLATQDVKFSRPPLYEGLELNLPKLYHTVQRLGGIKQVMDKKRWSKVAEEMRFTKSASLEKKYVRYLLPYDTLSNTERQQITCKVEKAWCKKNQKLMDCALNPLHRQRKLYGESDSSEDEADDESNVANALAEAEDCVVQGRPMNLVNFKKVAAKATHIHFPATPKPTRKLEDEYWSVVLLAADHVCVNTASIDTSDSGYGFTKNLSDPFGNHPWNLKMLSQNSGNVLRSLGAVLGVTVPTLHLGMLFSTSCWHRDPHGLPWIEYMHNGPSKIWYGIPNEQSENFRKAVDILCSTACQNKSIWLPSDIAMIPPNLLREQNVSLSRIVQNPREFIIVFPKAYSCSISTGYTESESVYFATASWLKSVHLVFQELRDSCEPTTFSLDHLLIALAKDPRSPLSVLQQVHVSLSTIVRDELTYRRQLNAHKLQVRKVNHHKSRPSGAWNVREEDECEVCRTTLYLSKVTGLPNKKSAMCLQHALQLLQTPKYINHDVASMELVIFFTESELDDITTTIQKKLTSTSS